MSASAPASAHGAAGGQGPAPVVEPVRDGFLLSGPVTIATASMVVDAMRPHWPQEGDAVVDFAGVTEADSAALALMFKWQRDSERKGRKVFCRNIPANVLALARLYGVEQLVSQQ